MNEEIIKTLEVLRSGGVIVYPTETVWGLGCDATNEKASEKIHLMKGTESSKSMLVLVDSPDMICRY
ncbi:MAG: Sua5/YciO/YrdC/YwlC family protein, partial [Bacteroidota bacterium]